MLCRGKENKKVAVNFHFQLNGLNLTDGLLMVYASCICNKNLFILNLVVNEHAYLVYITEPDWTRSVMSSLQRFSLSMFRLFCNLTTPRLRKVILIIQDILSVNRYPSPELWDMNICIVSWGSRDKNRVSAEVGTCSSRDLSS